MKNYVLLSVFLLSSSLSWGGSLDECVVISESQEEVSSCLEQRLEHISAFLTEEEKRIAIYMRTVDAQNQKAYKLADTFAKVSKAFHNYKKQQCQWMKAIFLHDEMAPLHYKACQIDLIEDQIKRVS